MDRTSVLRDLVNLRRPLDEMAADLGSFGWDSDEELVVLGPAELGLVLDAFVEGRLTAAELEEWSNLVEGRDDILFRPKEIIDLVFELANPLLTQPLTHESVVALRHHLRTLA